MKRGGKIKLVIPPNLAYAKNGVPGIPANSRLVFDIELLGIKAAVKACAAPAAGDAKAKQ
ncbi:FKBP-type peptidyl-prolyl cis-trans isomerase family protein [Candidatus Erwinia dacicola]|uniref:Peptidyl-prolyl cis-trans isomerase n=1 Tax=Candidatus Erwinia dacicola TaxID=252393 RepID=A0A328TNE8_9GAMM|nr:FKBP-type peptidyl-prolyl cis-trans isomerase family protein [Candidatus Erwinia dacicola]